MMMLPPPDQHPPNTAKNYKVLKEHKLCPKLNIYLTFSYTKNLNLSLCELANILATEMSKARKKKKRKHGRDPRSQIPDPDRYQHLISCGSPKAELLMPAEAQSPSCSSPSPPYILTFCSFHPQTHNCCLFMLHYEEAATPTS